MLSGIQLVLLGLSGLSAFICVGTLVYSICVPSTRIWPVASAEGSHTGLREFLNRMMGPLFGFSSLLLLAVSVLDFGSLGLPGWLHLTAGAILFLSGAAFAMAGVRTLGEEITHGTPGELEISGPYRFSRNPQYVGTVGVLLGAGLLANSWLCLLGSSAWCVWYVVAPVAEESFLRTQLGAPYVAYLSRTRRYL